MPELDVRWSPPAFDAAEYRARTERVLEECRRRGLDGLLLFAQESLYYLFGYDQLGYWVYQAVLLPASGAPPVAICRAADELIIRESPYLDDVRVWMDEGGDGAAENTAAALADRDLAAPGTRIGIELRSHSLLPHYYDEMRRGLPAGVELVDASDLVAGLRLVKSQAEVARFREAAGILDAAFDAAYDALRPGVRESDLHAAVTAAMYERGADPPAIPPPIASGRRTLGQTHMAPSGRRIEAGEPVVIEIGAAAARYHAVGVQCFAAGSPDPAVARLRGALIEALEAGFPEIGPGRPVAAVAQRVQDELRAAGLSRAGRHVGYGTGIGFPPTWLEDLRIKTTETRDFEAGMTFFYFAGIVDDSRDFCVYMGEPVLVTEDGHERVARPDHERWIVA
jgi:Xaa-Pro dipeptidase